MTGPERNRVMYHKGMRICLNAALLAVGRTDYRAAGISNYQHHLLRELARAAPTTWQLEAHVHRRLARSHAYPGIHLRPTPWSTQTPATRILWEQSLLPHAARDADLFHAMAFVSPALLATRARAPQVLTLYDLSFLREPQRLPFARRHYLRIGVAASVRRARRLITISAAVARDIATHYRFPFERIDIAPPGVDTQHFRPLPEAEIASFRRARQLPDRYWLYVGTLEPRKNLLTLLAAYGRLPRKTRPALVLAGGAGWGLNEIERCIQDLQLGNAVRITGFLPTEELPLWYNGAELFVYPSLNEGFGIPVLESMACGTPVLTSDAPALLELAADAGRFAPARDSEAWAEQLENCAQDERWLEAARCASLRRARLYTWAKTAARTITCYEAAIS